MEEKEEEEEEEEATSDGSVVGRRQISPPSRRIDRSKQLEAALPLFQCNIS